MGTGEIKINACGLSNPGPRMMVETALDGQRHAQVRVVVDNREAVEDLEAYFHSMGASIEVDELSDEFHILVTLDAGG